MMSLVLQTLEKLQVDLAAIDPTSRTEAADVVADIAVTLRDLLAQAELARRQTSPQSKAAGPMPLRAGG